MIRSEGVTHYFTVDVEEYFHVSALEPWVSQADWERCESRVVGSMMRLVEILAERDVCATHFVLGWVAERHPSLVRELVDAGHEVASHGWDHRRVTHQSPDEFRASVRRTKHFLEDLTGRPVLGFRAPSFSIVPGREWALDILIEEGYRYDSSLFPIRRRGYGYAGGARDPHWLERPSGCIHEIPPATLRCMGRNLPAAGGGYLRLLPYSLIRSAFLQCTRRGVPGTFYIHPWELDPGQPRFPTSWTTRLRHYSGLHRTEDRIRALVREFRFTSIAASLPLAEGAWAQPV